MQERFYTNVFALGNKVFERGYDERGKRFHKYSYYKPTLYVPSNEKTQFSTINGQFVKPIQQESIKAAREFVKKYSYVDNFDIYGSQLFAYTYLNGHFGNYYNQDLIKIGNIDLEVDSQNGFPEPEICDQEIQSIAFSITHKNKRQYFVFGTREYTGDMNAQYMNCSSEKYLLQTFLKFFRMIDIDVLTGWNIDFFDVPYLYRRTKKILGEEFANKLSPVGVVFERKVFHNNKYQIMYDALGLSVIDMLQAYKKFTYSQQESYTLNHIAHITLGKKKLDYSEVQNLRQLYNKNYNKFIEYNLEDVKLVDEIEDKEKFIAGIFVIAYDVLVNYADVFSQVKMWDVLIHNYLLKRNIIIPPKKSKTKNAAYEGAYVKAPIIGMHEWMMSFDLDGLYPHLIMQYNLSPETFIEGQFSQFSIDDVINRTADFSDQKHSIAANGYHYRKDQQGFLPEIMETMYNERKEYKQKMLKAQDELEQVNALIKELEAA